MWNSLTEAQPDGLPGRQILAFHDYRGVVVATAKEAMENQFITHWAELPERGWVRADRVKPTPMEADSRGCVLVYHRYDGYRVIGWRRVAEDHYIDRWQAVPKAPRRKERR